ncbi:MAG: hypothetical protein Q9159_001617 [Coniocarpon cinnabarinum]
MIWSLFSQITVNLTLRANKYLRPYQATWLYEGQMPCPEGSQSQIACASTNGGQFNSSQSSTLAAADVPHTNDSNAVNVSQWYTDTFTFKSGVSLEQNPFGVAESYTTSLHPTNTFGLGPDSWTLPLMQQQGHISSKVWSFWWGKDGPTAETSQDGSLVFGGYDRAKVTGPNITRTLGPVSNCPTGIVVDINDLELKFANGTSASVVSGGQSFSACVRPDWVVAIDVNGGIFNQFEQATGTSSVGRSAGLYFYGTNYPADDVFDGDMTVQLSGGLNPTISNSQLVLPDRSIDNDTGEVTVGNWSQSEVLINSFTEQNAYDQSILGRAFLSAAYLMVNQDAGTWTLWKANPTDEEDLVPVCNSTSTPAPAPPKPSSKLHKISRGAIAGAVMGSMVMAAFVIVAGVLLWRRYRVPPVLPEVAPGEHAHATAENKEVLIPAEPQEVEGRQLFGKTVQDSSGNVGVQRQTVQEVPGDHAAHELSA